MTTSFTLSRNNLPPTTISGSIKLEKAGLDAGQNPVPGDGDPAEIGTNLAIAHDQAFLIEFHLTITGLFASAMRQGKWELSAFFEKMGAGEVGLDQTKISKSFPVEGRDELMATIPIAAKTFPPGIYKLVASIKWLEPDDTPSDLFLIKDLGHFQVYEAVAPPPPDSGTISGTILSPAGEAMPNVEVHLDGAKKEVVLTDAQGVYQFSKLPQGDYTVKPQKDSFVLNGVSTFDLVKISRHILGVELLEDEQILAADVNNSGTINTLDLIELRKVILNINQSFPDVPSWRFIPEEENISLSAADANATEVDFKGVKMGDVSGDADPAQ